MTGSKLVYASKRRFVSTCYHVSSNAPAVDWCVVCNKCGNDFFCKFIWNADFCLWKTCAVKFFSYFAGKVRNVSRIKTYAKIVTFCYKLAAGNNSIFDAGFKSIVCINKENCVLWIDFCIFTESFQLRRVTHNPWVCHCSHGWNSINLWSKSIWCAGSTTNVCGSCCAHGTVWSLCTSKSKFHDWSALCCKINSGCFCSNKTLEINNVQNKSFKNLCFNKVCVDSYKRFLRENYSSFIHCVKVAGKMPVFKEFKKAFFKNFLSSKEFNVVIAEAEFCYCIQQSFVAG